MEKECWKHVKKTHKSMKKKQINPTRIGMLSATPLRPRCPKPPKIDQCHYPGITTPQPAFPYRLVAQQHHYLSAMVPLTSHHPIFFFSLFSTLQLLFNNTPPHTIFILYFSTILHNINLPSLPSYSKPICSWPTCTRTARTLSLSLSPPSQNPVLNSSKSLHSPQFLLDHYTTTWKIIH